MNVGPFRRTTKSGLQAPELDIFVGGARRSDGGYGACYDCFVGRIWGLGQGGRLIGMARDERWASTQRSIIWRVAWTDYRGFSNVARVYLRKSWL